MRDRFRMRWFWNVFSWHPSIDGQGKNGPAKNATRQHLRPHESIDTCGGRRRVVVAIQRGRDDYWHGTFLRLSEQEQWERGSLKHA